MGLDYARINHVLIQATLWKDLEKHHRTLIHFREPSMSVHSFCFHIHTGNNINTRNTIGFIKVFPIEEAVIYNLVKRGTVFREL